MKVIRALLAWLSPVPPLDTLKLTLERRQMMLKEQGRKIE
jgi:hypothetical protein